MISILETITPWLDLAYASEGEKCRLDGAAPDRKYASLRDLLVEIGCIRRGGIKNNTLVCIRVPGTIGSNTDYFWMQPQAVDVVTGAAKDMSKYVEYFGGSVGNERCSHDLSAAGVWMYADALAQADQIESTLRGRMRIWLVDADKATTGTTSYVDIIRDDQIA